MKTLFTLLGCLLISFIAISQQYNVIFNLSNIDNRPTINNLPMANISIRLRNLADRRKCELKFGSQTVRADLLQSDIIHIQDGRIVRPGPDIEVRLPFLFQVIYDQKPSRIIRIDKGQITLVEKSAEVASGADTSKNQVEDLRSSPLSFQNKTPWLQNKAGRPIWQDAIELDEAMSKQNLEKMNTILHRYYPGISEADAVNIYESIYDTIQRDTNIFLLKVLPSIEDFRLFEGIRSSNSSDQNSITSQSITEVQESTTDLLSPTVVLDAIATVIAKRLIEELNIAYLERFKTKLKQANLDLLFPRTFLFISPLGAQSTVDYKNLLTGLRQNLFEDLVSIPRNSATYLKKVAEETVKITPGYVVLLTALEAVDGLQNKFEPEEIISRLGKIDYQLPEGTESSIANLIKLSSSISDHLRIESKSGNWLGKDDLQKFIDHPRRIFFFAGLLMRTEEDLFEAKVKINEVTKTLKAHTQSESFQLIIDLVYQAIALAKEKHLKTLAAEKVDGKKVELEDFLSYTETLLSFLAKLSSLSGEVTHFQLAIEIVRDVNELIDQIHQKEFVAGGTTALALLTKINVVAHDSMKVEFFKYLSFAQNLVNATNREELIEALEQAADPVGNYRLKRSHPFTVSISAAPGLTLGHEEYTKGVNNKTLVNNFGFTAPIGLALSWGPTQAKLKKASQVASWTAILPIFDLGVITQFRIMDQQSELPDLKWENFIAPGLFLEYGFKASPLSIFAGTQYGPQARAFDSNGNLILEDRLWRFNIGLSVDLHLWSLFTKARN